MKKLHEDGALALCREGEVLIIVSTKVAYRIVAIMENEKRSQPPSFPH
jgi:hypothetical protein